MGWFNEQIRERIRRDDENFSDAMEEISSIITKRHVDLGDDYRADEQDENITDAIHHILRYYHVKPTELPGDVRSLEDQLEHLCRPHGIMYRTVNLDKGWYRDTTGAMLGFRKDGRAVALLPGRLFGYVCYDGATGETTRISKRTEGELAEQAICFYQPFPMKKLGLYDIVRYMMRSVSLSSYLMVFAMLVLTTLVGMLSPKITHAIYNEVIPGQNMRLFWAILIFFMSAQVGSLLIIVAKTLVDEKISTQMSISVQSATMARVISLPPEFFKRYSAGELTTKIQQFHNLSYSMYSGFVAMGLSSLFSLVYITQIFTYAPALVIPALCVTLLTFGHSLLDTFLLVRHRRLAIEASAKKNGLTYGLISGIQKIRLTGAEKRAFTRWTKSYSDEVRHTYGIPTWQILSATITLGISLIGTIVMYYFAVRSGISTADYYAFTTAYAMVSAAFSALVGVGKQVADIRPTLEQIKPIMDAVPEFSKDKKMITKVSGAIEVSNVSFRYSDNMPWVLKNLSLKIRPGEYVAIVGGSGCGKSTLLRLMMGFETTSMGAIYYDGRDISTLDLRSLRKNIGVVMQNGKLFQGDIFSNITISAPWLTMEAAWEAAEIADIADDIRAMPMGMHTVIAEGGGGISGGQKQRLMIARAVAGKPKILMFDEATSALDNITQKKVSQALDHLKCTRIVIAHRLSTIRHCDRIIVLDGGRIVEDGKYEELLDKGGFFAELVERQRLDV
jgi:NHLM bacteriocin system ABC transporter ATP-binding protein